MRKCTIEFDCGNAAFDDAPQAEAARILREIADKIEHSAGTGLCLYRPVRDVNGNKIGQWQLLLPGEEID